MLPAVRRTVAIALVCFACAAPEKKPDTAAFAKEIDAWRQNRVTRLKAEDSWLSLVGLS